LLAKQEREAARDVIATASGTSATDDFAIDRQRVEIALGVVCSGDLKTAVADEHALAGPDFVMLAPHHHPFPVVSLCNVINGSQSHASPSQ
jgi:hypothetical protein